MNGLLSIMYELLFIDNNPCMIVNGYQSPVVLTQSHILLFINHTKIIYKLQLIVYDSKWISNTHYDDLVTNKSYWYVISNKNDIRILSTITHEHLPQL